MERWCSRETSLNQLQGLRLTTRAGSPPLTSALPRAPARAGAHFICGTAGHCRGARHRLTLPHGESDRAHLSRRTCRLAFCAPHRAARRHRARGGAHRPVARRAPRADPVFPRADSRAPLKRVRPLPADPRHPGACARPSRHGSDAAIPPSPAVSMPRRRCCRSTARARACSRRSSRRWRGKGPSRGRRC